MGSICKCFVRQPLIVRRLLSISVVTLSFLVVIVILQQKPSTASSPTQNEVTFENPSRLNEEYVINRLPTKNKSKRLIWPEELPYGDRIREQMLYVPDTYKNETTKLKTILLYNGIGNDWEILKLNQGEFLDCPVSRCSLTIDKSLAPTADAILFRHHYERPKHKREPNQIWIIYYTEAPYSTAVIPESDRDMFNWTAQYRMDSDIPNPYGYWYAFDEEEMQKRSPSLPLRNYAQGKTKQVAWFVSNCHANSNRLEYATELSKYITVDIYGQCGPLECPKSNSDACFKMLETSYKFYLAFENAHCLYYITEKLFVTSYYHDVVPIVLGPSKKDYELVAPKNSFIHVNDFDSPQQLAAYLHELDKNDDLYNEYFKWKGTGEVVTDVTTVTLFYCRLCAMLHDENHPPKNYADINEWWRGPGVCRP
ncbi:glycoprotein 3-alpha-L-fucosyltransferase A-like [Adelges cooleyi]|uniref:glycoprotein 3-alpha-L-fucosyltransferase A-like n=1 Tax=Adelges cooleyi TaxID=133065 RepID=UPI0021808303|nr:glycoprotein 3-alpha-L-fucosyltransferase A-like [Adelges cooleyi]